MLVPTTEALSTEEEMDQLRTLIEEDRHQFDVLCRLTPRVSDALNGSSIMRELVPAEYGGRDGTMLRWFRLGVGIAALDGSCGWVAAQGAVQNTIVATHADPEFAREYFSNPLAYPALCIQTSVKMRRADPDHFELSGIWKFASGATGATFLGGIVIPDGEGLGLGPGIPCAFVRPEQVELVGTWNPLGLRGSGSYDLRVNAAMVPTRQVFHAVHPAAARITHRFAVLGSSSYLIPPTAAAIQLGIAKHALDLSREVLLNKLQLPASNAPMIEEPTVIRDLGWAEAKWKLALFGMERAVADVDDSLDGSPEEQKSAKIAMRACSAATAHLAAEVTRTAYDLAGTDASTSGSQLERCFRDAHVLTSHISVRTRQFSAIGRLLTGLETPADLAGL